MVQNRPEFAEHNVIAVFPDMNAARRAIEGLSNSGVEGANISLLGRPSEDAAAEISTREADENVVKHVGGVATAGGAIGTGAGAVAGAIAGAVAIAIPGVGPLLGAGIWIAAGALNGAIVGGTAGALLAGTASIVDSEAWERTFQDVRAGKVIVGVHMDERSKLQSAAEVLERLGATSIVRFNKQGQPDEPAQ